MVITTQNVTKLGSRLTLRFQGHEAVHDPARLPGLGQHTMMKAVTRHSERIKITKEKRSPPEENITICSHTHWYSTQPGVCIRDFPPG